MSTKNPQLLFELDALAEDGTVFQTSVRKIIPMTAMPVWFPAGRSPSAITGQQDAGSVGQSSDESLAQERAARYQCRKHRAIFPMNSGWNC